MNDYIASLPGHFVIREYTPRENFPEPVTVYGLAYSCPCGCGKPGYLPLVPPGSAKGSAGTHDWLWDGDKVRPTLQPSIRRLSGCQFHGYLERGVWRSAGDGAPVHPNCYKGGDPILLHPETLMPETTAQGQTLQNSNTAAPPADHRLKFPKLDFAPMGYAASHVLHFFDGVLHQLHSASHPGETQSVWVPIGGQDEDADGAALQAQQPAKAPAENLPKSNTAPSIVWTDLKQVAEAKGLAYEKIKPVDYGRAAANVDTGEIVARRDTKDGRTVWVPDTGQWDSDSGAATTAGLDPIHTPQPTPQQPAQGSVVSDRPPQERE